MRQAHRRLEAVRRLLPRVVVKWLPAGTECASQNWHWQKWADLSYDGMSVTLTMKGER
jgi:hypothetical protein